MMKMNKKAIPIVSIVALCCVIMALVDGVLQPAYPIKSAVKVVLC